MTQTQMLWHTQMSRLLLSVTCMQQSLTYWTIEAEKLAKTTSAKVTDEQRSQAMENVQFRKTDLMAAENALVEWVKTHPYPTE